jgi:hypothetical protein
MAAKAHYAATTLSIAAGGRVLPSLPVTLAYVRACDGDIDEWRRRWHAVARLRAEESASSDTEAVTASDAVVERNAPHEIRPLLVGRGRGLSQRWSTWPPARRRWVRLGAALVTAALVGALVAGSAATAVWDGSGRGFNPTSAPASGGTLSDAGQEQVLENTTVGSDCPAGIGRVTAQAVTSPPWSVGTLGGWKGDRCYGEYLFRYGSVADPPGSDRVDWTMSVVSVHMQCSISIFIPDSSHADGTATYQVAGLADGEVQDIDTQLIDQSSHHGDWVGIGPYLVVGGWLRLRMWAQSSSEVTAGPIHLRCVEPDHG